MPIRMPAFTIRCAPKTTAAEVITSDSLPLSEDTAAKGHASDNDGQQYRDVGEGAVVDIVSAAQPTIRLATPPEPLNKATISGMLVISTFAQPPHL
ncbi:MAG: hypothetical protein CM15mP120_13520 [Pseudomonadota bacterium]|nr:MAG: hypothetical protein CM15mP120_13520 [Pseudomonadota bacterium]